MGREWSRNQERDSETLPTGKPAVNGLGSFYRYHNHFFTLDWLIGFSGPRAEAEQSEHQIGVFLRE
ncbi:hypothetical protein IQ238_29925, partial [Pleurocapsales cyanobacterium LEGE 06147]|nr:hypothetical protein [Pleurocapsales cyanobacterium LEGE 06147]